MASDVKNVKLGPCDVMFGTTDLGYTKGGVEIAITTTTKQIMVDQFGDTAVNDYIQGRKISVKVPLAETALENLALAIPGSTLVTDATDNTKKKLDVPSGVGLSLRDSAMTLVCHPTANAADDKSDDFTVHLAAPTGSITFAYKVDAERIYTVEFDGYVDTTNGNQLFTFGDTSAAAA